MPMVKPMFPCFPPHPRLLCLECRWGCLHYSGTEWQVLHPSTVPLPWCHIWLQAHPCINQGGFHLRNCRSCSYLWQGLQVGHLPSPSVSCPSVAAVGPSWSHWWQSPLSCRKKNGLRWSQRLFIAENQNGKGTSGAQKLLKAPCGSIQGRATSQLDRKCLTLSPEMSTSLHSLLAKVKMMRWDGLRLLMGCSKFKFSRGASLLTLFRDVKTDGWLISTLIGHSVASYLLHDWLLMTSPKIYMYSN